jgi:hypothetical protein
MPVVMVDEGWWVIRSTHTRTLVRARGLDCSSPQATGGMSPRVTVAPSQGGTDAHRVERVMKLVQKITIAVAAAVIGVGLLGSPANAGKISHGSACQAC